MKKITLAILAVISVIFLLAQSPQAFKYQAVARDSTGVILGHKDVSFQISILQGSTSGPAVFIETHDTTTNEFGLVSLEIGKGIIVSGIFTTIDWGADDYFLHIELDENGGNSYQMIGTSQLLSVPYALNSNSAQKIVLPYSDSSTSISSSPAFEITHQVGDGAAIKGINGWYGNFGLLGALEYGVYGKNNNSPYGDVTYGYLGGWEYGVYGANIVWGSHGYLGGHFGVYGSSYGNIGILGEGEFGVYGVSGVGNIGGLAGGSWSVFGQHINGNFGYIASSQHGIFGMSSTGHAGFFDGKGFFSDYLGIGTVNPQHMLEVVGNIEAQSLTLNGIPVGTSTDSYWSENNGNIYYNTGKVGIGSSTPAGILEIATGEYGTNEEQNAGLIIRYSGPEPYERWGFRIGLTGQLHLDTEVGGTDYTHTTFDRLTRSVGIGTDAPAKPLHLCSAYDQPLLIESSDQYSGIELKDPTTVVTPKLMADGDDIYFQTDNVTRIRILSSGHVGIGTTTPAEKFTVYNGSTTGTYTTSGWQHSSDARLKTNISSIGNALSKVTDLEGVYYSWKNEPGNQQVGLIAQDVKPIIPEVVSKNNEGYYSISYGGIIPILVEAIKEQQEMIFELQKEIEELKK